MTSAKFITYNGFNYMNKQEIITKVKDDNITIIKLIFVDVFGSLKAFEITPERLEEALDQKISIDGSSIKGISRINDSDRILAPDLKSFRVLPLFESERFGGVAILMCDILNPDGTPTATCTRSNLKKVLAKMKRAGYDTTYLAFEPEFFLVNKDGSHTDSSGYADDANFDIRREIVHELKRVGIPPLTAHHEVAESQHEVNFEYGEAVKSCDNLILVRYIIKEVANRNGVVAIFEPKPFEGINGSGLHTNISLAKDGKNLFWENNGLSPVAKNFVAGILTHAPALCKLNNPSEGSYRRIGIIGFEAPNSICWGFANRTAMIRIPHATEKSSRIEVRSPDSTSNPYLSIAGILTAGLSGIKKKLTIDPIEKNIYQLTAAEREKLKIGTLPLTLVDATAEFKADEVVKSALTPELVEFILAN